MFDDYYEYRGAQQMNNFEKIKTMSIEEMAEFFRTSECGMCIYNPKTSEIDCLSENLDCFDGIKQWLENDIENAFEKQEPIKKSECYGIDCAWCTEDCK